MPRVVPFHLAAAAAALAIVAASPAQSPATTLTFGVYSFKRPTEVYRDFLPVTDALAKALTTARGGAVAIEVKVYKTYDECIDDFVAGKVDFVRLGPASFVTAEQRNHDIKLLAVEEEDATKGSKGVGVIVVAKDSPIRTLADLAGKSFAFGDENSTIGRYLAQAQLVAAGVYARDLTRFQFLERHDRVFKAVELGDYDAGALHLSILENLNVKGQLRPIATFDNVGKPWVARAGLDATLVTQLRQAMLGLDDAKALKALKISAIVPAHAEDFAMVRAAMAKSVAFTAPAAQPAKE